MTKDGCQDGGRVGGRAARTCCSMKYMSALARSSSLCDDREQALALAAECPAAQWATVEVRELGPCFM